jgi:hypothetical protein
MKRNWAARVLKVALFAALFVTVFGFVVMRLWNWLMPALFGLHPIAFWQATGLLILCKILFGGFHGRQGHGMHWRHRMTERWEQMTPEEREKFRQSMGGAMPGRCGSFEPPAAAPKT